MGVRVQTPPYDAIRLMQLLRRSAAKVWSVECFGCGRPAIVHHSKDLPPGWCIIWAVKDGVHGKPLVYSEDRCQKRAAAKVVQQTGCDYACMQSAERTDVVIDYAAMDEAAREHIYQQEHDHVEVAQETVTEEKEESK